jgi:hypothetical protein
MQQEGVDQRKNLGESYRESNPRHSCLYRSASVNCVFAYLLSLYTGVNVLSVTQKKRKNTGTDTAHGRVVSGMMAHNPYVLFYLYGNGHIIFNLRLFDLRSLVPEHS